MVNAPRELIMLCGLPKTGKSAIANKECKRLESMGFTRVRPQDMYPVEMVIEEIIKYSDKDSFMQSLRKQCTKNCSNYIVISLNDIKTELSQRGYFPNNLNLLLIAETRYNVALARNYSVIYDAMNLDKSMRQTITKIADDFGVQKKTIIVTDVSKEHAIEVAEDSTVPYDTIPAMYDVFKRDYPSVEEGWDELVAM